MNIRNILVTTAIDAVMSKAEEMRIATPESASAIVTEAYQLQADLRALEAKEKFDLFDPKHLS